MKGYFMSAPVVKKSECNLLVGVIFLEIMFPNRGLKLEEGIQVSPVFVY